MTDVTKYHLIQTIKPSHTQYDLDFTPYNLVSLNDEQLTLNMSNQELIRFSNAVRESTLKRLKQVPPGFENWKIVTDSLSIAEIAKHILDSDNWLFEKFDNEALPSITPELNSFFIADRNEFNLLLDELSDSGKKRAELIASMKAQDFNYVIFDDRFDGKVTKWWIIVRGNIDHEIHHRGQIALYLKVLQGQNKY